MCRTRKACLVLDVDDTLVATFAVGWRKCVRVAELMGLPAPDRSLFAQLYGTMSFHECVIRLHPGVDVATYARHYDGLADAFPAQPIGDIVSATSAARDAGFALGVLTNGPGHKTDRKLAALGLSRSTFDFVRDADSGPIAKPHPAAFHALGTDFGICLRCSWYASDQPADWAGAAAAGMRTIGVLSGDSAPSGRGLLPLIITPALDQLPASFEAMRARSITAPAAYPTEAITTVSLDAGFTLIGHVRSPGELIADLAPNAGLAVAVDDAMSACDALLHNRHDRWQSDITIHALLTEYYGVLLRTLGLSEAKVGDLIKAYTRPENWRALPGAAELIATLERRGMRTVVLSNWQSNLAQVLDHAGIQVSISVSSAESGFAKPDPAAMRAIAAAAGVDVHQIVHCGDDARADVGVALAAGCPAILLNRPDSATTHSAMSILCADPVDAMLGEARLFT